MSSHYTNTIKKSSKKGWTLLITSMILGTIVFFLFPDLKEELVSQVSSRTSQYSSDSIEQSHLISTDQDEGKIKDKHVDGEDENVGGEDKHADGEDKHIDGNYDSHTDTKQMVDTQYTFNDLVGAAIIDDTEKVRNILTRNPELRTATDGNGWQVIHEVSRAHAQNVLKMLVQEFGANVNARTGADGRGYTPLALALANKKNVASPGEKEVEIVSYLKSIGALSLQRGEYTRDDLVEATRKNDVDTMTAIIRQHPEYVHQKDKNGWTPLHEAIRAGHAYAASHLVEFGHADVNVETNIGVTPLYMATHHSGKVDETTVRYLLKMGGIEKGPDIDEL